MIYLVEDDDSIRELVLYTLHTTGFEAEASGMRPISGRRLKKSCRSSCCSTLCCRTKTVCIF